MSSDIDEEYEQFQRDVHILIEGTFQASSRYLDGEAKSELAKIEEWMKKTANDKWHEHLVDERVEMLTTNAEQKRFLRPQRKLYRQFQEKKEASILPARCIGSSE